MLRQKSDNDQKRFRSYFKHLNVNRVVVTGDPSSAYNCISWSVGLRDRWLWPGEGLGDFDAFYNAFGFERTSAGTVAIWGRSEKEITHASVLVPGSGSRWESKCGVDLRIQHSLNELNDSAYGKPIAYYSSVKQLRDKLKSPDEVKPPGSEYSADELALIKEKANQIPKKVIIEFEKQFEAWRNTWFAGLLTINSNPYSRTTSYEFFRLLKMKEAIIPLVVQKLTEKDNFMALLLYERLQQNQDLIALPCPEEIRLCEGEQGRAYRTVKAYLLNE